MWQLMNFYNLALMKANQKRTLIKIKLLFQIRTSRLSLQKIWKFSLKKWRVSGNLKLRLYPIRKVRLSKVKLIKIRQP